MYEVLKFFFQESKKEKFYMDNKDKIIKELENKKVGNHCIINMQHSIDILYL